MKLAILAFLSLPVLSFSTQASDCKPGESTLSVRYYTVDPQRDNIVMYWKKADGTAWGSLQNLLAGRNADGRIKMVMNGGIYAKSSVPLGLYIEKGHQWTPLNKASGGGNFFIRPGGVFYLKGQQAGIVTLDNYQASKHIDYAVQSGPLMIENGVINRRLLPTARSQKIRNAVGITSHHHVVFMLSEQATSFYDFACYARSQLDVRQMLYLDGTISRMYQKGDGVPWQYHPFVTLIAVESKRADR